MAAFARRITVTASDWEAETTDLARLDVRANTWWGDQGPEDAFVWMLLPADEDEESFASRLRSLTPGDVVQLRYERGLEGTVYSFPRAIVSKIGLPTKNRKRRSGVPFRSDRIVGAWENGKYTGDLAITFRIPGEGHAFGPGSPMNRLTRLPTNAEDRKAFVIQTVRELHASGSWESADPDRDSNSATAESP